MLRWNFERYSFWDLPCHACNSCNGWHVSFCSRRRNSYIAVATCRQCGAHQFLKKYRQFGNANKSVAQWEYEALRHLNGGSRNEPAFLLPRAYNFAATTLALSMEYLKGESMDERMRHARDRQGFDDCLRVSATWLKGLHAAPAICDTTGNDSATLLRRLESNCKFLAARNVTVTQALMCMRRSLDEINSSPVKRVLLHADFKTSNLMWAQDGVYGIDVGLRFKNSGAMDAAQFIADLLLNRRNIQTIADDRDVALILDVFLEAYGDNSRSTRNLTVWWLMYFLLSRWEEDLKDWKSSMLGDRRYVTALADSMAFCEVIGLLASPANH